MIGFETPNGWRLVSTTDKDMAGHSRAVLFPCGSVVVFPDSLNAKEFISAANRSGQQLRNKRVQATSLITNIDRSVWRIAKWPVYIVGGIVAAAVVLLLIILTWPLAANVVCLGLVAFAAMWIIAGGIQLSKL
jgi:threonine aldolase